MEQYEIKAGTKANANEVYFDGKPSEATREALKGLKMRWNGSKKCWYGFVEAEAIRAAIGGNYAPVKAEAPKEAERISNLAPIKFYYNGIKINGGDLIKCTYYKNSNTEINILAKDYSRLPREYFPVTNDTDIYTDYFCEDCGTVAAGHPLYEAVKSAYEAETIHDLKHTIKYYESHPRYGWGNYFGVKTIEEGRAMLAELEKNFKQIQPTNADLLKIEEMHEAAENARRQAEQEEQQRIEEDYRCRRANGAHIIREAVKACPVADGAPVVHFEWSEHPAFYAWNDKEVNAGGLVVSLAAADRIFKELEAMEEGGRGYYKTSFAIYEDGGKVYDGRYDIGDQDGGLFKHIRSFISWQLTHDVFGHEYGEELTEEQKARKAEAAEGLEWLAGLEAQAQNNPKPTTAAEQAQKLNKGDAATVLYIDGMTAAAREIRGTLNACDPCQYAQYADALRVEIIPEGTRNAKTIYIHDGMNAAIFAGIAPAIPDAMKVRKISETMTELLNCGAGVEEYQAAAINYLTNQGAPLVVRVQ